MSHLFTLFISSKVMSGTNKSWWAWKLDKAATHILSYYVYSFLIETACGVGRIQVEQYLLLLAFPILVKHSLANHVHLCRL